VLAEHLGQNKLSSLVTVTSWPDEQAEYKKGQGEMVTLDELRLKYQKCLVEYVLSRKKQFGSY